MASANDSSKRRRLLGDASPGIKCLSDLPNGVLTHAASYLDAPSRAFFAASLAINQDAAAASDERNISIVDHEWSTLDFGDIEKDLVVRLIDGDISSILMCIDAVNKLKTLKLTNCFQITGTCLEPLRGSTMIKQIDLSLVGKNKSPKLSPPPPISCDFVVPILDSIIEREGCSLRHLQFPKVWRQGDSDQFDQFLHRYSDTLLSRGIMSCHKCSADLPEEDDRWIEGWIELSGHECGSQNYTCGECLKYYCHDCEDDNREYWLNYCERCERRLCLDCQSTKYCTKCQECYCADCKDFIECSACNRYYRCKECTSNDWSFCYKCGRHFCGGSVSGHCSDDNANNFYCEHGCDMRCCNDCEQNIPSCGRCFAQFCDDCNEKKIGMDAIRTCENCDEYYCGQCLVSMMEKEEEACTGCIEMAGRVLLEEFKKVRQENTDSKAEIKELMRQVGKIQDSNNSLKEQLQYQKGRVKELEKEMKQISIRKC